MDAADIVDVVSEFVTLRKRGVNYIGLCPFHSDRTPSFSVSPSKGICKCFACGKGGNVVHFIMEHEQLSYPEALHWLAKKYGIPIQEKELTEEQKQNLDLRESLFVVNQYANEWFQKQIGLEKRSDDNWNLTGIEARQYFARRGFRDDIIKRFQLGYCPSAHMLFSTTALRNGYKKEYLLKTGLCYEKDNGTLCDRFHGRVIFPIHSLSGKVVGFGGRVLDAATKGVKMKYVNSPESEIYHKSRELYGIFFAKQAIVRNDCCFLVEGYTDVISMHQCGVENVVASSGTALTQEQIRLIHRFTANITLLFDGDAAGIKASLRGVDMLLEEGMHVKVCLLPDGEDPDSFARKHNATDFQHYIQNRQTDFLRFKTLLLREESAADPVKKVELLNSIVQSISVIPDSIARAVYVRECASLLEVDEKVLVNALAEKLRNKQGTRMMQDLGRNNPPERYRSMLMADPPRQSSEAEAPFEEGSRPLPPEIDSAPSEAPPPTKEENAVYSQEEQLVQAVIRYGERIMCNVEQDDGTEIPLSVIGFIVEDLKHDGLEFRSPLFRKILKEAESYREESGFVASQFFLYHADVEISRFAAEEMADRYQLSHLFSRDSHSEYDAEHLYETVSLLMIKYKLAIVQEEMVKSLAMLSDPQIANDAARCKKIMERYRELQQIQSLMAHHAGERVVNF